MRIIILGNKAAETIKKHIVSVWDNIDVLTYKSVDLLAQDLDSRSIACDRIIITEEVIKSADNLQVIKDFLEERYMTIQIVVILKTQELHAPCTDICYDESTSVVFCMSTMKANFVKDLPTKTIAELRTAYADSVYKVVQEEPFDTAVGVQYSEDNYSANDGFDDMDDFGADSFTETDDFSDMDDFTDDDVSSITNTSVADDDFDDFDNATYTEDNDITDTGYDDFDDSDFYDTNDAGTATMYDSSTDNTDMDFDGDELPDLPVLNGVANTDEEVNQSYFDDMNSDATDDSFEDFDDFDNDVTGNANVVMDDYLPDDIDDELPDDYNLETVVRNYEGGNTQNNVQTTPVKAQTQGTLQTNTVNKRTGRMTGNVGSTPTISNVAPNTPTVTTQMPAVQESVNKKKSKRDKRTASNMNNVAPATYTQMGTKYAQTMNGQALSIIIVTGDRRAGLTTTAFQMAEHFATKVPTLYVDFDIVRRGSLLHLSLDDLLRCNPEVQNGLGVLRVGKRITNVAYKSPNCDFDALVSIPNYALSDETLIQTQTQLLYQREYNAVVIDCPFDHLYLLSDVLSIASIYICMNGDIANCSSTILELDRLNPVSKTDVDKRLTKEELEFVNRGAAEKNITTILRGLSTKDMLGFKTRLTEKDISMLSRGQYIITGGVTEQQFLQNMQFMARIYNLSATSINWATLRIAGIANNLVGILQNMI